MLEKVLSYTDVERRRGRQAPSKGRCEDVLEVEPVLFSLLHPLLSLFEPAFQFSDKVLQSNLKLTELPLLPFLTVICPAHTYAGPAPSNWK